MSRISHREARAAPYSCSLDLVAKATCVLWCRVDDVRASAVGCARYGAGHGVARTQGYSALIPLKHSQTNARSSQMPLLLSSVASANARGHSPSSQQQQTLTPLFNTIYIFDNLSLSYQSSELEYSRPVVELSAVSPQGGPEAGAL